MIIYKSFSLTRNIRISKSWKMGSFWLRIYNILIHIKAPWATVYFSEREGYRKFYPKSGWRVSIEKERKINTIKGA